MKLGHYLLLSVSALFAVLLAGVGFMYVSSTRDYLQEQLEAHAQETATSLALAIGSAANPADTVLLGTIVNPVFDRGQFEQIDILSVSGAQLVSRKLQPAESQVPGWFQTLFPIDTPGGQALISAGWRQAGRVVVVPRPALAYSHLWQSTIKTLAWLGVLYLIALIGLRGMLSLVLRALTAIESAAQDLGNRKFRLIEIKPRARELKSVVAAFNVLSQKIRSAIDEEVTRAEQFRHDAFMDPLTAVYNRRGLELQVQQILGPGSGFKPGTLALLEIGGLTEFNSRHGFQKADDLLREVAELLAATGVEPAFLCGRLSGATFVVLLVGTDAGHAADVINGLCGRLQSVLHVAGSGGIVSLHAGAVQFDGLSQSFSRLLSAADLALARAVTGGDGACEIIRLADSDGGARGSGEWRRIIEQALAARQLSLFAQTVLRLPGKETLQKEINVRLQESAGLAVEAKLFLPMALRHKLGPRLDATVLDLVMERMALGMPRDAGVVAINICGPSLQDQAFIDHLSALLAASPQLAARLVFETSEAAFLEHIEATPVFAARVRALGAQFALDNFLVSGESLKRLESLLPFYIKLSSKFTADLFHSAEARFLVSSLVRITQSLEIPVIAQGIEQEQSIDVLVRLSVSGVQGYVVGKPEPW
jgi:diguanylate cyclase (GGDEF)-like protein